MSSTKSITKTRGRILKKVTSKTAQALKNLKSFKSGQSDHLDSYDTIEEKYEFEKANRTLAQKRRDLIKTLDEKKADLEREKKQREKDIGASKQTIHTLKCMSSGPLDFIEKCYAWNINDAGVKKSKGIFEDLEKNERIELDATMTEAWVNRPSNCHSLRSALLNYAKQYIDLKRFHGSTFKVQSAKKINKFNKETLEKIESSFKNEKEDAPTITVMSKLESITRALHKLDEAKRASQREVYFPNSYRFCQQQSVSSEVRKIQFHMGSSMSFDELCEKFPIFVPLPKIKTENIDVDNSTKVSERPLSPSLLEYKKLEAAEAEVKKLKILNDLKEDGDEKDEDDEDGEDDECEEKEDEGGGYDGEQGDVYRQVFADDSETEEDGPHEEISGAGVYAEEDGEGDGEADEVLMNEQKPEELQEQRQYSSSPTSTNNSSHNPGEDMWRYNDEEMMFAEAFSAMHE